MIALPRNPLKASDRATRRHRDARSRRRFARRQWLRRWLAWRYVVGSVLLVALVAGGIWLVFFCSVLDRQAASKVAGRVAADRAAASSPRPTSRTARQLAARRPRARSGPGSRPWPPVRQVDVSRDWPDGVLIAVTERTAGRRGRRSAAGSAAMDADGVLFRDYAAAAPPACPRVRLDRGRQQRPRSPRRPAVIAALPAGLAARVDHVEVATVDQISLVLRDGARRGVGERRRSRRSRPRCSTQLLAPAGARPTTSASPASRSPAPH